MVILSALYNDDRKAIFRYFRCVAFNRHRDTFLCVCVHTRNGLIDGRRGADAMSAARVAPGGTFNHNS